jgi:hypothetical protein
VRCNSISASRHAAARHRWRPQPDHDRVADAIETMIFAPCLICWATNQGLSDMTIFGHRDAGSTGGLKYRRKRLRGIAHA